MKKIYLIIFSLIVLSGFWYYLNNKNIVLPESKNPQITPIQAESMNKDETSLFVPYWGLNNNDLDADEYDQLLYFGITPLKSGEVNTEDSGFLRLPVFVAQVGSKQKTALVLRMLNSTNNFEILKDQKSQDKLIQATNTLAKENGFEGVVLNLELSALPFDSLIQQINNFNEKFYTEAKSNNLSYAITIYGDNYYRVRPFDVKALSKNADQVMIMAYDLFKAGGNPDPNFPLSGKDKYGYDFSVLMDKLLSEVPAEKVSIIFGLYGYDWQVDDKNIAQKIGKPLSYLQIKQNILNNCTVLECIQNRDVTSQESTITYTTKDEIKHTVWYEDLESVAKKQEYLKSRGISNFSFWAYSYF